MPIEVVEITGEQTALLLSNEEGHFLELKSSEVAPAAVTKAVSAFANSAGGELFVGIEERFGESGLERVWRGYENQEAANGLLQALEGISPLGNHFQLEFLRSPGSSGLVVHITVFKGEIFSRRAAAGFMCGAAPRVCL